MTLSIAEPVLAAPEQELGAGGVKTPLRETILARFRAVAAAQGKAIAELTDDLVDLLTETIHQIGARAERRVDRELLEDLKRVSGKQNLLFDLAGAALDHPDGIVREVVFPVVGEQTACRDLTAALPRAS